MSIQVYWAISMFIKLSPFHLYGNNLKFSIKKLKKMGNFFFLGEKIVLFSEGKGPLNGASLRRKKTPEEICKNYIISFIVVMGYLKIP